MHPGAQAELGPGTGPICMWVGNTPKSQPLSGMCFLVSPATLVLSLAGVCGLLLTGSRKPAALERAPRWEGAPSVRCSGPLCGRAADDSAGCARTVKCTSFPVLSCSRFAGTEQKRNLPRAGARWKATRRRQPRAPVTLAPSCGRNLLGPPLNASTGRSRQDRHPQAGEWWSGCR